MPSLWQEFNAATADVNHVKKRGYVVGHLSCNFATEEQAASMYTEQLYAYVSLDPC